MLVLDNISYGYGAKIVGSMEGTILLSNTLSLAPITLITGSNGTGKSTFLRTLAGLIPLFKGNILWQNGPLEEALSSQKICYLSDRLEFSAELSTGQILTSLQGSSPNNRKLLDLFNLNSRTPWKYLSTGQKQKLRLCLVFRRIEQADLIILDEPFSGLDAESQETAIALLHENLLGKSKRLLICLHQEPLPPGWAQNELHFHQQTLTLQSRA